MVVVGHFHRKAYYDADALQVFNRGEKGGIYWYWHGFNLRGMGVWLVAATAGLFFTSNAWFVGPGAALAGGADIGFLVAGVVAAVLYPAVIRVFPEPREVYGEEEPAVAPAAEVVV
jgi:purine-cytosine permease-like protein